MRPFSLKQQRYIAILIVFITASVLTFAKEYQTTAVDDEVMDDAEFEKLLADATIRVEEPEYPYEVTLTCGLGGGSTRQHINILPCLLYKGSSSDLEITNGDVSTVYKPYNVLQFGMQDASGFHFKLKRNFKIHVQNASDSLVLGIQILDSTTGKSVYQKQVGTWDSIHISSSAMRMGFY